MKHRIAFALIMGIVTTALVSFTLIAINVGFGEKFLAVWLRSWSISYVVAVLAILVMGPHVQLFVNNLLKWLYPEKE